MIVALPKAFAGMIDVYDEWRAQCSCGVCGPFGKSVRQAIERYKEMVEAKQC